MNNDKLKLWTEADWINQDPEMRALFEFRLMSIMYKDIQDLKRLRWTHRAASFAGGIVGGIVTILAIFKAKLLQIS